MYKTHPVSLLYRVMSRVRLENIKILEKSIRKSDGLDFWKGKFLLVFFVSAILRKIKLQTFIQLYSSLSYRQ